MKRIERMYAVAEALRRSGRRGRTAEQLAAEFGVSTRTVKRDLKALEAAGTPIWGRTGPGGGYGVTEGSALPPVNLTTAQALALSAAVSATAGGPFGDSARAAVRKVIDALEPGSRRQAAQLAERIWVNHEPPPPRRILSPVEQALTEQRRLNLVYCDRKGNVTRRQVEPMILAHNDGRWWLVAWCLLRDDVRWFELGRIQSATVTRQSCGERPIARIGTPPETAHPVTV
ncbi:MAG TPA: WYL domain-containing protein [Dermatophilaceae bacterium]|nr:WYL domain-containing protein [Dermatophilaceae bacterium]